MSTKNFYQLDPELVMRAAEDCGYLPTGRFVQLNSYENRVFDLSLEDGTQIIAKFYRPGRWSEECILEEHHFLHDLTIENLKAVAPLMQKNKKTLSLQSGLWTAFFPKVRGRLPDELFLADLEKIGFLLAQVHLVGRKTEAQHRPFLHMENASGWRHLEILEPWIAPEVRGRYLEAAENLLALIEEKIDPACFQRIHGDLHRGNILSDGKDYFLVDFDDMMMGPVVQDFWMLLSGDEDQLEKEKQALLKGYTQIAQFPTQQWSWIPLLRGYRIIAYSSWIAQRWQDPSFPRIFPDFKEYVYWARETEALEKAYMKAIQQTA